MANGWFEVGWEFPLAFDEDGEDEDDDDDWSAPPAEVYTRLVFNADGEAIYKPVVFPARRGRRMSVSSEEDLVKGCSPCAPPLGAAQRDLGPYASPQLPPVLMEFHRLERRFTHDILATEKGKQVLCGPPVKDLKEYVLTSPGAEDSPPLNSPPPPIADRTEAAKRKEVSPDNVDRLDNKKKPERDRTTLRGAQIWRPRSQETRPVSTAPGVPLCSSERTRPVSDAPGVIVTRSTVTVTPRPDSRRLMPPGISGKVNTREVLHGGLSSLHANTQALREDRSSYGGVDHSLVEVSANSDDYPCEKSSNAEVVTRVEPHFLLSRDIGNELQPNLMQLDLDPGSTGKSSPTQELWVDHMLGPNTDIGPSDTGPLILGSPPSAEPDLQGLKQVAGLEPDNYLIMAQAQPTVGLDLEEIDGLCKPAQAHPAVGLDLEENDGFWESSQQGHNETWIDENHDKGPAPELFAQIYEVSGQDGDNVNSRIAGEAELGFEEKLRRLFYTGHTEDPSLGTRKSERKKKPSSRWNEEASFVPQPPRSSKKKGTTSMTPEAPDSKRAKIKKSLEFMTTRPTKQEDLYAPSAPFGEF